MNESEKLRKISVLNDQEMKKATAMYASGSGSGSGSNLPIGRMNCTEDTAEWRANSNWQVAGGNYLSIGAPLYSYTGSYSGVTLDCWNGVKCQGDVTNPREAYASDWYTSNLLIGVSFDEGATNCMRKPDPVEDWYAPTPQCYRLKEKFGTNWKSANNYKYSEKTLRCWDETYVSCEGNIKDVYYGSDAYVSNTVAYATCTSGSQISCPTKPDCDTNYGS